MNDKKDTLFDLDSKLIEALDRASEMEYDEETKCYVDTETGEVLDLDAEIAALGIDRKKKLVDTALYITRLNADSDRLASRAKQIADRAKAKANYAERLKKGIAASMVLFGDKKIETDDVVLTTRSATAVQVVNESTLPTEYVTVKTETKPNKIEIAKALKNGIEVSGAVLVTNTSVIIK